MSSCSRCDIEEKIIVCCGRNPADGSQALRQVAGRLASCCPHLDLSGQCGIYDQRPTPCRDYFCERYGRSEEGENAGLNWLARLRAIGDIRWAE